MYIVQVLENNDIFNSKRGTTKAEHCASLCKVSPGTAKLSLDALAAEINPSRIPWSLLRSFGLVNRQMPLQPRSPSSGRILAHAHQQVTSFREHLGVSLCVFKVGVTASPVPRYVSYRGKNFTAMWIIFASDSVKEVHMLEAALISLFHSSTGCQNMAGSGGEGALNKPGATPPFYVYVTGGRADQNKRVG